MSHRKQHFVNQSYLEAWCDPDCPDDHEPYVWRFDKDGSNRKPKAPTNIFWETDMYTIERDGKRDLCLERGLSQLEMEFARIRREKLSQQEPLNEEEHVLLCAFIAAAHGWTPVQREHWRRQWQPVLKIADDMAANLKRATDEQKRAMGRIPHLGSSGPKLTHEQVRKLVEQPTQSMLFPKIRAVTPGLVELDFFVLETDDEVGFITSDHPCVWYDPEGVQAPSIPQSAGANLPDD